MAESDESLVAAAKRIFRDEMEPGPEPDLSDIPPADAEISGASEQASTEVTERIDFGRPDRGDMITVRGGGLYLPVRRRVGWMRGLPEPHPDWTIETFEVKVVEGKFIAGTKVEGGYARMGARVFDSDGRLIATGTKTEYSERFLDFVEKAETGAIGRALAVAGYGTEAAVDLDEGYEQDRIADAPVTPNRPINITPSAIPNVRPGGRPDKVQNTQKAEIGRLNKALGLGLGIVQVLEAAKGEQMPPLEKGKENAQVVAFLDTFTHDQAGEVVQQLNKALQAQQKAAAEVNET
jgi:hypothetical protein